MKKNILLCIFLSLGTLTAWAQEQTSLLPANEMKGIITGTPQEKIKDTNLPGTPVQQQRQFKKSTSPASISDYEGTFIQISEDSNGKETGYAVEISVVDNHTLAITNFWNGEKTIKASINLEEGTLKIDPQEIAVHSTYGSIFIYSYDFETNRYNSQVPIQGTINDGVITIDSWIALINEGEYKSYSLGVYRGSELIMPNSNMTETTLESNGEKVTTVYPVYLEQSSPNELSMYNAANIGVKINLQLNSDKTIAIPPQTFLSNAMYGKFNCYPLKTVSATNPEFFTDRMIKGTISGTDLSWENWGIFCPKAGIVASLYTSSVLNTLLEISFPKPVVADFEGKGTPEAPYLIKTMEDLYMLSEVVNSDKTLNGDHTSTYAGQYFRLESNLDATTLSPTLHPIGYNAIQRFAGIFDGNNKTIRNLTMDEGMGYCALFGHIDTDGVIKNLNLENYTCETLGSYGGSIAGYVWGKIENCHTTGAMSFGSAYTGGIAGYSYGAEIINCSFKGTMTGTDYMGGIVGTSFGNIKKCWADATINFTNNNPNTTCGGITSSMFGTKFPDATISDCYFTGRINATNNECTVGGIAGSTNKAIILRCFNTAMISGTGANVNMGGILGFTWNTTIRDCYNSGLIGNNLSPKVGGVIGSVLDMSDEERSNIENCYNSGLVYTASKEEMRYIVGRPLPRLIIKNTFYDQQITGVPSPTYGLSTAQLTDAGGIKDFDPAIWNFTASHYPRLKGIDENNAAYLSSACMSLDESSSTLEIRKDFDLTTDNRIEWKAVMNTLFTDQGHGFSIKGNKGILNGEVTQDTIFAFNADKNYKYYILSISPILWKGKGTATDPFLIETKADMMNLGIATNDAQQTFEGMYFKMTADIDMEYDEAFIGLGRDNTGKLRFAGVFDGNGYTISKMKITSVVFDDNGKLASASRKFTGFIGSVAETGVVKNLTIAANCEFDLYVNAGAIAGYNYGLIENCRNYATVKGYMNYVGGITGYNAPTGILRGCFNTGAVYAGTESVGGIAGANNGLIENCQNCGYVSALSLSVSYKPGMQGSAGGIVGLNSGILRNVINTGKIASYKNISGIAGKTQKVSGQGGSIVNAINYGKVEIWTDRSTSGQIIGDNMGATEIIDSYYDIQLQTLAAANNQVKEGASGCKTRGLINGKLNLPDSAWVQKENTYPMLISFKNEAQALVDSRAVIVLDDASTIANMSKEGAKLQNNTEVTWELLHNTENFRIEEGLLKVTMPTDQIATDTLVATYGTVKRTIPIMALYNILEGKGTQEEPWLIKSTSDMNKLSDFVMNTKHEYKGENFKVMEDLDFSGINYTPIAIEDVIFQGYFDGNGKTIKNITYAVADSSTVKERGLFGVIGSDGTIANLTLSNCKFQTYQRCGAFAGSLYGTITNCTNDHTEVSTTGTMHAGGIAGFGYLGAAIENCKNNGNVTAASVHAGGILGGSDAEQTVKISKCSNEGNINAKTSQVGGIIGRGAANIEDCYNTSAITISSSNAGGIAGDLLKGSYINKCHNTANIIANTCAGGIVGTIENHSEDMPFILENCYNTGEVSTTYSVKSTSNAGGIVGKAGNACAIRNCYNTAPITTTTGNAGGIAGGITGSATAPSIIEKCYNAKEATILANTNYAGGIAGNATYTYIQETHNEADVTAGEDKKVSYAGGIAGGCTGYMDKSWNSGKVTAKYSLAGGIAGNAVATIDRCYNRGEVISEGIEPKKSVSTGGILGKGNSMLTNCYNTGTVTGFSEVGGIIGSMVAGSKTEPGTTVTGCYNLGTINATSTDSIGNITGLAANYTHVSASFYDKTLCSTHVLDTCATALTSEEMVNAQLGDAFLYGVATYPRIDAFEKDTVANFYATMIILAEGDEMDDIKKNIQIGTPEGIEWTATSNLSIDGNTVSPKNSEIGEEATLILTAGDLEKAYHLILNVIPDGIDKNEMTKVVVERTYYTVTGIRVAKPAKGQINIEKRIYDDGTSEVVKTMPEK